MSEQKKYICTKCGTTIMDGEFDVIGASSDYPGDEVCPKCHKFDYLEDYEEYIEAENAALRSRLEEAERENEELVSRLCEYDVPLPSHGSQAVGGEE